MPREPRLQGLSRRHRFVERDAYGPVLKGGRKLRGRLAVLHVGRSAGPARLGIALTRRMIPLAVERNRVRRLAREAFRRHVAKHMPMDIVISLRHGVSRAELPLLRAELVAFLDQLSAQS